MRHGFDGYRCSSLSWTASGMAERTWTTAVVVVENEALKTICFGQGGNSKRKEILATMVVAWTADHQESKCNSYVVSKCRRFCRQKYRNSRTTWSCQGGHWDPELDG